MSNEDTLRSLGKLIPEGADAQRDAVHIAVAPVVADEVLQPGDRVAFVAGNHRRVRRFGTTIGIIDPFLSDSVQPGQACWLYLNPGSITSLRHDWTHPAFAQEAHQSAGPSKSESERWMRAWAVKHMGDDYYSYEENAKMDPDVAYGMALRAGREHHIGPYEDARSYIDDEWWTHWEAITGERGERGAYFSCAC